MSIEVFSLKRSPSIEGGDNLVIINHPKFYPGVFYFRQELFELFNLGYLPEFSSFDELRGALKNVGDLETLYQLKKFDISKLNASDSNQKILSELSDALPGVFIDFISHYIEYPVVLNVRAGRPYGVLMVDDIVSRKKFPLERVELTLEEIEEERCVSVPELGVICLAVREARARGENTLDLSVILDRVIHRELVNFKQLLFLYPTLLLRLGLHWPSLKKLDFLKIGVAHIVSWSVVYIKYFLSTQAKINLLFCLLFDSTELLLFGLFMFVGALSFIPFSILFNSMSSFSFASVLVLIISVYFSLLLSPWDFVEYLMESSLLAKFLDGSLFVTQTCLACSTANKLSEYIQGLNLEPMVSPVNRSKGVLSFVLLFTAMIVAVRLLFFSDINAAWSAFWLLVSLPVMTVLTQPVKEGLPNFQGPKQELFVLTDMTGGRDVRFFRPDAPAPEELEINTFRKQLTALRS